MTKKNIKNFFLISDSHVGNSSVGLEDLTISLKNMKKIDSGANLIHLGDITNYGDSVYLNSCLHEIEIYFPKSIVIFGNHDVRGRKNGLSNTVDADGWLDFWKVNWNINKDKLSDKRLSGFSQAKDLFHSYNKKFFGAYEYEKCFIFALNTERPLKDSCYLTNKQINLLKDTIDLAQKKQKTLFIISHQALNNTHKGSSEYGGFGPQNDLLEELLHDSKNIIFWSGHIHNGLDNIQILKKNYGYLVDVPSFCYPDNGVLEKGIGYYVSIEENKIIIEPYFLGNIINENYKKLIEYNRIIQL